jgi:Lon protease-like protein
MVRGMRRFEISGLNEDKLYLRGEPAFFDDGTAEPAAEDLRKRAIELRGRLMEVVEVPNQSFQDAAPTSADSQLSYRLVAGLPAELEWQQNLLELRSEPERLDLVIKYLEELIQKFDTPDERPGTGQQVI